MKFPPRARIAPLLSRRAIIVLASEVLVLCALLPVARWLGAVAEWLVAPWCVLWLAVVLFVCTAPLLLAAGARRVAAGRLLFFAGSAGIGAASLALNSVAYDGHLRATMSRLDPIVTAVESHRRTSGSLPGSLAELATNADCGLAPDEWHRLCYELQPESKPPAFCLSWRVPDQGPGFPFSFGTYLAYGSQWEERRIKGSWRDLGRGWKLIEGY